MKKRTVFFDQKQEVQSFTQRAIILMFVVAACGLALIGRLVYLQVAKHDVYSMLSWRNQVNLQPIAPSRGLLLDRFGVVLAENTPIYNLMIVPDQVKNIPGTIRALQKIVRIDTSDIEQFEKIRKKSHQFDEVPLKLQLTEEEMARFMVDQFRYPGAHITVQLVRYYPYRDAFTHVLGYVGRIDEADLTQIDKDNYKGTDGIGKLGIEKYYEDRLHGEVGYQAVETDASGQAIRVLQYQEPTPGKNIVLTLDAALQLNAIEAMGEHRGALVAIEPKSGDVLSLVSKPGFDPNLMVRGVSKDIYAAWKAAPDQPLYNRAVRGQYPLASTIKPFLSLGALTLGVANTTDSIHDPGWYRLPGVTHQYRDWRKEGHGMVNLPKAIMVSCDTYFYTLAVRLGITRISDILTSFGFGDATYIDLHEESPGLVPTPGWKKAHYGQPWYLGDTVVAGIGQGYMLTTPLQLANAAAIMANRGVAYQPHLLKRVLTPDHHDLVYTNKGHTVVKADDKNWDIVIAAMKNVVMSPQGTAFARYGVVSYTVAGKTGTAQVFNLKNRDRSLPQSSLPEYLRDHSLFIAFAPVEDPKIAVAVVVENDKVAAPIVARKIIDFYLNQIGYQPPKREPDKT
jgi:penicillin-binding protein 2